MSISSYDKMALITGRLYGTKLSLFRYMITPQMIKPVTAAFMIIFAIVLGQSEIPSLLSYPVYAAEISSRAIIDDDIRSVLIASFPILIPSILLALFASTFCLPKNIYLSSNENTINLDIGISKTSQTIIEIFLGLAALFFVYIWVVNSLGACCSMPIEKNISTTWQTLILTGTSSIIAILIAFFSADIIIKLGNKHIQAAICFCITIFVIPSLITGLGLMHLKMEVAGKIFGYQNFWLIIAYIIKILPVFLLIFLSLNASDDIKLNKIYESNFLCWSARQRFIRIPIFLTRLAFLTFVGIAVLSSELTMTILLVAPGTDTIVLRSYNLIHYGAWNEVILISSFFALTIIFFLAIMSSKLKWGTR